MRKIVMLISVSILSMLLVVGCSGKDDTATPNDSIVETNEDSNVKDTTNMCSDESFQILQTNFGAVVEAYNAVKSFYENEDSVKADADIEDTLNMAADIINKMGEIKQEDITEEDAVSLNDSMLNIVNSLSAVGNGMVAEMNGACSNASFKTLQSNYAVLTEVYNNVKENIGDDEESKEIINQVESVITTMGSVDRLTLTEEGAQSLNDDIVSMIEVLSVISNK